MTRGPLSFKETDLVRAIKSAAKAGLKVAGFEITKAGNIVVHGTPKAVDDVEERSWDKALSGESR
jgi:hypothetical protein